MLASPTHAHRLPDRRVLATAVLVTLAVVAVAATPQLLGSRVLHALDGIGRADPAWLWVAALGFLASLAGAAGSWRSAIRLLGGSLSLRDANARYGIGSLVNTFVPARAGDAVRIALFSRALDHRDRLWTAGGAFAAISAARALVLAGLVVCGALFGALPLWPLLILFGLVGAAVAAAWLSRGRRARTHAAHVLDAFRALGSEPLGGLRILAWIALGTAGRIVSAAAIAASLGVPAPVTAALIIVPALDLAGLLPLTPGNVGVTSGAVAMALQAHGVGLTHALSTGITFHAVETGVSLLYGLAGLVAVIRPPRRWILVAVTSSAALALACAFSATVLVDLV